jgi:hypothetical protein
MFNNTEKKVGLGIILFLLIAFILTSMYLHEESKKIDNTLIPILHTLSDKACDVPDSYFFDETGYQSSAIIYHREKIDFCPDGSGNQFYFRCYHWNNEDKGQWVLPTKDIEIKGAYSCSDEKDVRLNMFDKKIQQTTLNKKSYFKE